MAPRHKICEHGNEHCRCVECQGSQVCIHKRYAYYCKECPGKGICQHGKIRHDCRDCQQKKRTCKQCKVRFYLPKVTPYCSPECQQKWENKKTCHTCDKEFYTEAIDLCCGEECAALLRACRSSNKVTRYTQLTQELEVNNTPRTDPIWNPGVFQKIWWSLEGHCYYCGRPTASFDHGLVRKDFSAGFCYDNLIPCCFFCSRERQTKTHEELISSNSAGTKLRHKVEGESRRKAEKQAERKNRYRVVSPLWPDPEDQGTKE